MVGGAVNACVIERRPRDDVEPCAVLRCGAWQLAPVLALCWRLGLLVVLPTTLLGVDDDAVPRLACGCGRTRHVITVHTNKRGGPAAWAFFVRRAGGRGSKTTREEARPEGPTLRGGDLSLQRTALGREGMMGSTNGLAF